jgi:carbon monoxide dehydrogenase subunit G
VVRIAETFSVASPPEAVFDYMVDPANLRDWQTSKTRVEPVSEGAPRRGYRVREWTKPPGGREFEQTVEFAEFERGRRLGVHIVEGPQPIDGTWTLAPEGEGTRVDFAAEGDLRGPVRFLGPLVRRAMARQFAGYHRNLRRNVEALRRG